MIGSFLNVVIHRLPKMLELDWKQQCVALLETNTPPDSLLQRFKHYNLWLPASHCPKCFHTLSAWENIPLLSYLALKGKCRQCAASISSRYPLVELCCAILSCVVVWHFGFSWQSLSALVLTWGLVALSAIDFDHQILPDHITLPLLWLGLLLNTQSVFISLETAVYGAIAGYLSLWSVYWLFKLITGKEGMGYGDFKLLALLGAWLGWKMLPLIILLSSFVGAVVGLMLILIYGRDKNIPIPFGPYLAAAGWIALLWGQDLINTYFNFVGIH